MTTYFPSTPTIVDSNRILYTASSFARSSLLHLQEVGSLTALQPHTSSRSDLPSYLFFEVVSGAGKLVYQGKTYELRERSCVFIDCMLPGCSPAKNQREDCVIPYIVDYTLRNHHILRPTPYWLTLNNSCQKTGI